MRIAAVLAVLVAAGCSSPSAAADWRGDSRFSTEERAAIESGEAWLAEHAGREPATFDWNYEVTATVEPRTVRRENAGSTGLCRDGVVFLNPDDPNAAPGTLDGLAAHEMAHCELGFVDDPKSDGIMHFVSPMRWTPNEDAQCVRAGTCGHSP